MGRFVGTVVGNDDGALESEKGLLEGGLVGIMEGFTVGIEVGSLRHLSAPNVDSYEFLPTYSNFTSATVITLLYIRNSSIAPLK